MVCVAVMTITSLSAQLTSTKNTYSIYSMYGIGDIATQGSLATRSMGGAGVASRSSAMINLLNPASYSMSIPKGILMDIGVEGEMVTNTKLSDRSSYLAGNVHNISLQIPLAKGIGLGFGIAPYSTVGYYMNDYATNVDYGLFTYNYTGSGDITEVNLGVGVIVTKGLSIGASLKYYWGLLERYYSLSVTPITTSSSFSTALGMESVYVSNFKAQFGVQWDVMMQTNRRMTLGATYDLGGDITPEVDYLMISGSSADIVTITSKDLTEYQELKLPHRVNAGITYRDRKWHLAADFAYQAWGGDSQTLTSEGVEVAYVNSSTLKLGFEYIPNRMDARYKYKRFTYRGGARAGNYYQSFGGEKLPEWAITAGIGFPISMFGMSNVDLGVEYGGLGNMKSVIAGTERMNLIRQNSFKVSIGVTLFGDDYWFQRIKYD